MGLAAAAGSYAFVDAVGWMVTTYERLRTDTTVGRFSVTDADGVSRAARYDAVAVGDLFEWRQAEDCWIRFRVTVTDDRPPGGVMREFGVRPMTYAFTGCSGTVAANTPATLDFGPLPDIGNPELTYPVRHGPWQFVPTGWTGPLEDVDRETRFGPALSPTSSLAVARRLPYWRDPGVPLTWSLKLVERVGPLPHDGYRATYVTSLGQVAVSVGVYRSSEWGRQIEAFCGWVCDETRVIAGRPARVWYGPLLSNTGIRATVWVYDPDAGVEYMVREENKSIGGDVGRAIAIARGLFEPAPSPPNSLRYGRFDTDGAAGTPGSHAFLSGLDHDATTLTTHEELRGDAAKLLLIHTSDVDETSRAGLFDALEAGDALEWWRADNCWIRYHVTEVMPDPPGQAPRKLFGVTSGAFAFTGCTGDVPRNAYSYLSPGPLPTLGGTSLEVAVAYGPWTLVPEGGRAQPYPTTAVTTTTSGQFYAGDRTGTSDLDEARLVPHWREPALPADWRFASVIVGALTSTTSGYCATFGSTSGPPAIEVCGTEGARRAGVVAASWDEGAGVREFRTIHGRPALATYSPPGPNHSADFRVEVSVYDAATGIAYTVFGYDPTLRGSNVDAVIALAESLFEGPHER